MAELKIEKKAGMPHNLILEDRKKLVVSGVEDVDSFDEQTVVAYTAVGELMIKGEGLHINKLSLETGELTLDGEIASLTYTENRRRHAKKQCGRNRKRAKLFWSQQRRCQQPESHRRMAGHKGTVPRTLI